MNVVSVLFDLKAKLYQLAESHLSLSKRVQQLEKQVDELNAAITSLKTASDAIIAKLEAAGTGVPLADVQAAAGQINTIAQSLTAATNPPAAPAP